MASVVHVLAVIPARYNSTRFPGKPLVPIAGRPMVLRVWDRARLARRVDHIVVATDDERIRNICSEAGVDVVMTRNDHATGTDRLAEVSQHRPANILVNVQGDEPLIDPDSIDAVVSCLEQAMPRGIDVATAYQQGATLEQEKSPSIVHLLPSLDGCAIAFSRLPIPFSQAETFSRTVHIGIYAFTPTALGRFVSRKRGPVERAESLEQYRFLEYGDRIACIAVLSRSIGVDLPEDVEAVEAMLRSTGHLLTE